jgi:hypothetical protein
MPLSGPWRPLPGDQSEGATPVPLPNTAVKPFSANGTARATVWESRSSPGARRLHIQVDAVSPLRTLPEAVFSYREPY